MENIKNILDDLNRNYPGWQKQLEVTGKDDDLSQRLYDFIIELKRLCQKKDSDDIEIFLEFVEDQQVAHILQKQINRMMVYYNAFRPIRGLSFEDSGCIISMIEDIFYNYILRFDPQICERYEISDSEGNSCKKEIFNALDCLTNYYVKHLMVQREVRQDFEEETGLSKEVCDCYATLYEKNFSDLKMNLLLQRMESIQNYMRQQEEDSKHEE